MQGMPEADSPQHRCDGRLDNATGRIVASAKIDKFLGNVLPEYKEGLKVRALVTFRRIRNQNRNFAHYTCQHRQLLFRLTIMATHEGFDLIEKYFPRLTIYANLLWHSPASPCWKRTFFSPSSEAISEATLSFFAIRSSRRKRHCGYAIASGIPDSV